MGRRNVQKLPQKTSTNGQKANKKEFYIIDHQENTNQINNEITPHTRNQRS